MTEPEHVFDDPAVQWQITEGLADDGALVRGRGRPERKIDQEWRQEALAAADQLRAEDPDAWDEGVASAKAWTQADPPLPRESWDEPDEGPTQ